MEINKRDLIRFVGERLYDYYRRGVLSVAPAYDTTDITETTPLAGTIKEFFIQPYYNLLEYRDSLKEDSLDRITFEQQYPKLEYEVGEVAQIISGAIKEYISIQNQADVEKEMLSRVHLDEKTRASVQETLKNFGRVADNAKRKNTPEF